MKKNKKNDIKELPPQIEYTEDARSVMRADIAMLIVLALCEIIAGIFLNGYSVAADGVHNIISAAFCLKIGSKLKKPIAVILIPVSAAGVYLTFNLMAMTVSYADMAPAPGLFPVIAVSIVLKILFALNTSDKIKLSGYRYIKPVSAQMYLCFAVSVAALAGLFFSFFAYFFIEAAVAMAICFLTLLDCFRVFEQHKPKYIEKLIDDEKEPVEVDREPDEFAPISVARILKMSKEMGDEDKDENSSDSSDTEPAEEIAEVSDGETDIESKSEKISDDEHREREKDKRIFRDEHREEEDDW